ncbi:MAG: hypothetical protein ACLFQK_12000 [Fibrobacterota bacterium]
MSVTLNPFNASASVFIELETDIGERKVSAGLYDQKGKFISKAQVV